MIDRDQQVTHTNLNTHTPTHKHTHTHIRTVHTHCHTHTQREDNLLEDTITLSECSVIGCIGAASSWAGILYAALPRVASPARSKFVIVNLCDLYSIDALDKE